MGLRIDRRGSKATPKPIAIRSHKRYTSLTWRDILVDRIKRLNRLLNIQQYEIRVRYQEVAARYQEVVELRWALLKAQCFEQARQLFGAQLSHVVYKNINVGGEKTALLVSVYCMDRQPSDSINGRPERTALPFPSPEQQEYELELLDGCLADSLQRSQWMPRRLVLELCDWKSDNSVSSPDWPYVSRRRAEFCRGSFDACAAWRKETQLSPTEVAKVSVDTALVICDDDPGEESGEESYAESVTP
ncbi:hypothetical protein PG985_013446 [Apiospora marii]|uniref:uncharacterized protein n=1 Tax=Apiospora marii TaxID=335849 RepID=UPI003130D596